MPVRQVGAHPRVDDVRGQVAFERGPLVYAFEGADQADGVVLDDLTIAGGTVTEARAPEPFTDIVALSVPARLRNPDSGTTQPATATGIPYFAWANRGPGPMRIWIPAV